MAGLRAKAATQGEGYHFSFRKRPPCRDSVRLSKGGAVAGRTVDAASLRDAGQFVADDTQWHAQRRRLVMAQCNRSHQRSAAITPACGESGGVHSHRTKASPGGTTPARLWAECGLEDSSRLVCRSCLWLAAGPLHCGADGLAPRRNWAARGKPGLDQHSPRRRRLLLAGRKAGDGLCERGLTRDNLLLSR